MLNEKVPYIIYLLDLHCVQSQIKDYFELQVSLMNEVIGNEEEHSRLANRLKRAE